ncbi:MAG: hypothetical protein ACRD8W_01205 [Nitrososphaeraceae archaeon]
MLTSNNLSEKHRNSSKTTTMTFRIDSNVMRKINNEAAHGEISINALVNQILKRYVEWDMSERKAGMVPVSKPVISHMFSKLTKEEVVTMAEDVAKNAVYDIALFMKGKIDTDSFLIWFLSRMKTCSEISDNINDDGSHTYILKHDLGGNWSLYQRSVLELIFTDFLHKPIRTSITDSTITLTLENRHS